MSAETIRPTLRDMFAPALAGAVATLTGNGLARFAYVPLFPAMVSAGWVSGAEAGLLGALNLAGYLAGVLGGRRLAGALGTAGALNAGIGLVALSFVACTWHAGLVWLAVWRFLAGIAGGVLMGLAGPAVQGAVPPDGRGRAGGMVMMGVGAGIVVASVAVPLLLRLGVSETWLGLAAITVVLWAFAARAWPTTRVVLPTGSSPGTTPLYLAYGLSAAGFVPHMVYFADLVARGRGLGTDQAALALLLFGAGGFIGPLAGGWASDRWGGLVGVRAWLLIQVAALALVFVPGRPPLFAAAFLGGFAAVGLSAVTLARARELAGLASGAIWVRATAAFAIAQAVTGFGFAWLFSWTHSHDALFAAGLAFSVAAVIPVFVGRRAPNSAPPGP